MSCLVFFVKKTALMVVEVEKTRFEGKWRKKNEGSHTRERIIKNGIKMKWILLCKGKYFHQCHVCYCYVGLGFDMRCLHLYF